MSATTDEDEEVVVPTTRTMGPTVYQTVHGSADFRELRSRLRRFVFPMSAAFLAWYLLYVLLASYAPGLMAVKLLGNINVGLVVGLLQFASTFLVTTLYVRFAARRIDPAAAELRARIERIEDDARRAREVLPA